MEAEINRKEEALIKARSLANKDNYPLACAYGEDSFQLGHITKSDFPAEGPQYLTMHADGNSDSTFGTPPQDPVKAVEWFAEHWECNYGTIKK